VYLATLDVVVLTRATARRLVGALVGGLATGAVTVAVDALGRRIGWWHFAFIWATAFLASTC